MTTYTCKDNDRLDQICAIHYGKTAGAVEAVLTANPGLADIETYYAGLVIELPALPSSAASQDGLIRLWS